MFDITSILFAARELCESFRHENKKKQSEEYSSCSIGEDTFYFPKKKIFEEKKEDIVLKLF